MLTQILPAVPSAVPSAVAPTVLNTLPADVQTLITTLRSEAAQRRVFGNALQTELEALKAADAATQAAALAEQGKFKELHAAEVAAHLVLQGQAAVWKTQAQELHTSQEAEALALAIRLGAKVTEAMGITAETQLDTRLALLRGAATVHTALAGMQAPAPPTPGGEGNGAAVSPDKAVLQAQIDAVAVDSAKPPHVRLKEVKALQIQLLALP